MKDFSNKRLIQKAKEEGVEIFLDRLEAQEPYCIFGLDGVCCKNCFAGPCRVIKTKQERGICGVNADMIASRNLLRHAAAGVASHGEHAREILMALHELVEGKINYYEIKDKEKLKNISIRLGKNSGSLKKIAMAVCYEGFEDFRRQRGLFHKEEGTGLNWMKIHTDKNIIKRWKGLGILPWNIDLDVTHALHQTVFGNDADPEDLMLSCLRMGITDGAAMHMATDLQDVLFGTPKMIVGECNLGTLKEDYVNIAVHGHVPLLSMKIVEWAKKLEKEAKKKGAKGVNIVGICCTAHETLMRQGVHAAGHVLQAEMAIVTGALEAMIVDTQCIYPSLQNVASCYHTKLITTMVARIPGATHIPFHVEDADQIAKQIVRLAIDNYLRRAKERVYIPNSKSEVYSGFSAEEIFRVFNKVNKKKGIGVLGDAIKNGDVLGVVAVVGCRNPKRRGFTEEFVKRLMRNGILVLTSGCIAHSSMQAKYMLPSAAEEFTRGSFRKFLERVGKANELGYLPPVLHTGSCVDNSRFETVLNELSKKMHLSLDKLPVVIAAPEALSEKSFSIACWGLALGLTGYIHPIPIKGAKRVIEILTKDMKKLTGGEALIGESVDEVVDAIVKSIKNKRKYLK